jgi:hypothetical protein
MDNKILQEVNTLIAKRVPPGDRWQLVDVNEKPLSAEIIDGIVEALSEYMRANNFRGDYRLSPLDGKLYAISQQYTDVEIPKPKKYDLYGEF